MHCKEHYENKCENCLHEFCTAEELSSHQQQECERLIEIESNELDCKPTVVDYTNSEGDNQTAENQAIELKYSDRVPDHFERPLPDDKNKTDEMVSAEIVDKSIQNSNSTVLTRGKHPCALCDRTYNFRAALTRHLNVHQKKRFFKCFICKKS